MYGFLVQNQSVLALWVCNLEAIWRVFSLIATLQLLTYALSKLMGKYSKASKKEQCRVWRPRSKIQAASRWCRHSTTNRKKQTQLDRRRRRATDASQQDRHIQSAPLLRLPLPHQNDCSTQPFEQKNNIFRSIAEDPVIAEYTQVTKHW